MQTGLIWTDVCVALFLLIFFAWGWYTKRIPLFFLRLFLAGTLLGALWEWPLYFAGPEFSAHPPYRLLVSFPLHPILQPICHMIWDGGLCMMGISVIIFFSPPPYFQTFRLKELGIYILWGISSALCMEILGALGIWEYIPSRWNPELFQVQGKSITLLAPLTWAIAPIFHYLLAIWLNRRS